MYCQTNARGSLDPNSGEKVEIGLSEAGSITFTKVNLKRIQNPHNDPLAI